MHAFTSLITLFALVACGAEVSTISPQAGGSTNFSGTWFMSSIVVGAGGAACTGEPMKVTHTSTQLTVLAHKIECDNGVSYSTSTWTLDIAGSSLLANGRPVGQLGPDSIHVDFPMGAQTYSVHVDPSDFGYRYKETLDGQNLVTAFITQ